MGDPLSLEELARRPRPVAEIGGKARHLARLIDAGIQVPPGVVVATSDSGPIDPTRVAHLGDRLAVRSSSPLEDRDDRAAPGLFASVVDVAPADLDAAVGEVRASATGELARLYADATGAELPPGMAVIVQRYAEPDTSGTTYTRMPGRPEVLLVEPRGDAPIEIDRDARPPDRWAALVAACLDAESALSVDRGVDVEWVESDGELWIVQARPLPPPPRLERPPPESFDFARRDPEVTWRLDLRHNPEPLSPAQRGLVDLVVDRSGAGLGVACGYLYERIDPPTPGDPADLEALFFAGVEPAADVILTALERDAPDLEAALDGYAEVHRLYSGLSIALSAARRAITRPGRGGPARAQAAALAGDSRAAPYTRERCRALAALEPRSFYAAYAAAWDVSAPPIEPGLPAEAPPPTSSWAADLCAAVAELDDRLFYRAQHQVRRALLELGLGDDVFWLPLDDVRAGSLEHLASRADSARRLHAHQQRLWMPAEVRGDERVDRPPGIDHNTLRGRGLGGRARGRVYKLPISRPISTDAIITAVDLTPADALAARRATGVALEAGSLLGHGAAMARELGIPIVVQIPGLCRIVEDGEPVALDGETGLLVRVRPR